MTNRRIDRQEKEQTDGQIEDQTNIFKDKQICKRTDRQIEELADRRTSTDVKNDRLKDRKLYRKTDKLIVVQIDKQKN